jgi:8-oxo-dGTP diphosphatase
VGGPIRDDDDKRRNGRDYIGVTCQFFCHDGTGRFVAHQRGPGARDEHGKWEIPGGALEFGETWEEAVCREAQEEYCLENIDPVFIGAYNMLRTMEGQQTHWIALVFAVRVKPEEIRNGEPHKISEIGWFTKDSLPEPPHPYLGEPIRIATEAGVI